MDSNGYKEMHKFRVGDLVRGDLCGGNRQGDFEILIQEVHKTHGRGKIIKVYDKGNWDFIEAGQYDWNFFLKDVKPCWTVQRIKETISE